MKLITHNSVISHHYGENMVLGQKKEREGGALCGTFNNTPADKNLPRRGIQKLTLELNG